MYSARPRAVQVLLTGGAVLLVACSDSIGPEAPAAGSVSVSAPVQDVPVGASIQLTATVLSATGAIMSNVPVTWTSAQPQVAQVSTSGVLTGLMPGAVTIRASAGGRSGSVDITVRAGPCAPPITGTGLTAGQTRTGNVNASNCILPFHGMPASPLTLTIATRTRARVHVTAQAAPILVLTDMAMTPLAVAADESGSNAATLLADLEPGSYAVWVSLFEPAGGSYQVQLEELPSNPCTRRSIALGESAAGSLSESSCLTTEPQSGRFAEVWDFVITQQTMVRIGVASDEFDTVLVLRDATGAVIGFDDDGGSGTNSRISAGLPAGQYSAWVTSYAAAATGGYTIALAQASACSAATAGAILPGHTVSGQLSADACTLLDGPDAEGWSLSLSAPARIRLRVQHAAFAPMVAVTTTRLDLLAWSPASSQSTVELTGDLPAGEYYVWVGTFDGGSGGYQLSVEESAAPMCQLSGTIAVGQTVSGSITQGGCTRPGTIDHFASAWRLELTSRTSLQIDLTSSAFDALLIVTDAAGNIAGVDDDGGEGLNSRLRATLDAGSYTIWAGTYGPGQTGPYQLSVSTAPAASGSVAGRSAPANLGGGTVGDRWKVNGSRLHGGPQRTPSKPQLH